MEQASSENILEHGVLSVFFFFNVIFSYVTNFKIVKSVINFNYG